MKLDKIFNDLNRLHLTGSIAFYGSAIIAGRGCAIIGQAVVDYGTGVLPLAVDVVGTSGVKALAGLTVAGLALDACAGYAKKFDGPT